MEINRDLLNELAELSDERYRVTYISWLGDKKTIVDSLVGALGWVLPEETIVSVERIR